MGGKVVRHGFRLGAICGAVVVEAQHDVWDFFEASQRRDIGQVLYVPEREVVYGVGKVPDLEEVANRVVQELGVLGVRALVERVSTNVSNLG